MSYFDIALFFKRIFKNPCFLFGLSLCCGLAKCEEVFHFVFYLDTNFNIYLSRVYVLLRLSSGDFSRAYSCFLLPGLRCEHVDVGDSIE